MSKTVKHINLATLPWPIIDRFVACLSVKKQKFIDYTVVFVTIITFQ